MKHILLAIATLLVVSCSVRHPVQLTPESWTAPDGYEHCEVAETVTLPDVGKVVIVECVTGVFAFDYKTKKLVGRM